VVGFISAVVVAAGVVGVAAAGPPSTTTTVRGPATYIQVFGPATAEGWAPAVLVRWRVRVGAGGRAGEVRPQLTNEHAHPATGRWVRLPARPGTYAFAAPHVLWDQRSGTIRLDQRVGGHAILERLPGRGSPDVLRRGVTPVHGRRLTITTETEPDLDRDRVGDQTEDRTDLAVTAARGAGGALDITVTNRGRRSADLPLLRVSGPAVAGWAPACHAPRDWGPGRRPGPGDCVLPAVAPGETFTVRAQLGEGDLAATVTVAAEGPDLAPGDNGATLAGS
jgi:hypothetical protein